MEPVDTDTEEHICRLRRAPNVGNIGMHLDTAEVDNDNQEILESTIDDIDERIYPPTLMYTAPVLVPSSVHTGVSSLGPSSSDFDWEWVDNISSDPFTGMFEEVSELAALMHQLRRDVKDLNSIVKGRIS